MASINLADPEVFRNYFEEIASNLKALAHAEGDPHFYPLNLFELSDAFKSKVKSPSLLCLHDNSGIKNGKSYLAEEVNCILYVIAKAEREEDAKLNVLKQCKEIVYSIISKLKKDRDEYLLLNFDEANINIQQVDSIADNWHGYRLSFSMPVAITALTNYNADKWEE